MKFQLLLFLIICIHQNSDGQINVNNTQSPSDLVNTFVGPNISISNIKFNGTTANANTVSNQFARFVNNNPTIFTISQGVLLTTGNVSYAMGPNDETQGSSPTFPVFSTDPDLAMMTTQSIAGIGMFEFDFVSAGPAISFEYVFASEEYPEFIASSFNDVLGAFLSGPGINGPYTNNGINIMLLPGTSVPITINTVNNGMTNTGPCMNCTYYISNGTGSTRAANTVMQYDGLTTTLTASATIVQGETYHLKIGIANASDSYADSAIFLKNGSFQSTLSNQEFEASKITMSPNPASLSFVISGLKDLKHITIYDMLGRTIQQNNVSGNSIEIDISDVTAGNYFVEIVSGNNGRTIKKLIVE